LSEGVIDGDRERRLHISGATVFRPIENAAGHNKVVFTRCLASRSSKRRRSQSLAEEGLMRILMVAAYLGLFAGAQAQGVNETVAQKEGWTA